MAQLIEEMLEHFDNGNMEEVNRILDLLDEMEGYKNEKAK